MENSPPTIICIGMAGSGKTTFVQRLNAHLHEKNQKPYLINLDPAVYKVPFGCNIDIRDSIKYKKVMDQYNLGPNGAIVTSLNLFSTKIDQVLKLINNKKDKFNHCVVDTPGQIECFVWSASGSIITEAFATESPTVIAYIVDTPRCRSPSTFMSNMLYACSILYKTKLPMVIVFNKTDVQDAEFATEWMKDFEAFQAALKADDSEEGNGYMSSLVNSMSLMLEEFYSTLDVVGVSSYTGAGFDDFLTKVDDKVKEFNEFYTPDRERIVKEKKEKEEAKKEKQLNNLMKDMGIKDKKKGESGGVDVLSDFEDEVDEEIEKDESNGYQHGLIDMETEREYTFQDDRLNGELEDMDELTRGIKERYQRAFEANGKEASSEIAEDIANYINNTQ